jgi:hypothetical protein
MLTTYSSIKNITSSRFGIALCIPLPDVGESWTTERYNGDRGPFYFSPVQYSVYSFDDLMKVELHAPYPFVIVKNW